MNEKLKLIFDFIEKYFGKEYIIELARASIEAVLRDLEEEIKKKK